MRFDRARWAGPVPNMTPGGMSRYMGVTLHIMEGTLNGTDGWFHNPKAQASAHFGIGKDGETRQWVDTADKAWAQAAGNPSWISIELEGRFGEPMTPQQVVAVASVYGWAVKMHGVPIQLSDRPAMPGLGYHAMGGAAWGGHPCPGQKIVDQRAEVLRNVYATLTPTEKVTPMFVPAIALEPIVAELACPAGGTWLLAASGALYAFGGAPGRRGANGQDYFKGRKAARLVYPDPKIDAPGSILVIVATSGERYAY